MSLRQTNGYLRELYLEYYNEYLTVAKFAEHNQIEIEDMRRLLDLGKRLHEDHVRFIKTNMKGSKK